MYKRIPTAWNKYTVFQEQQYVRGTRKKKKKKKNEANLTCVVNIVI